MYKKNIAVIYELSFTLRSESEVEDEAAGAAVHAETFTFQRSVRRSRCGLPAGEVVYTPLPHTHKKSSTAVRLCVRMPSILMWYVLT